MAKHPPLSKEQKERISKFKTSSKKPSEISKELNIPPKQIGGYLHYLRRPSILNQGLNPKQTQVNPEQIKENKPSPKKPESPQPGPKIEEVKTVAIEQQDLEKIQKMINDTTTAVQAKTIELTKQSAGEAVTHALTNFKEAEKREKERLDTEAKQRQQATQIGTFCSQFPELCKRVDTLEKKAKPPEKPEEPEKEIHNTAKEYLECKECGPSLIRAMAKMTKTNPDFAKSIQETLKTQGITIELPKVEEKPPNEEKPPEEGPGPF